MQYKQWLGHRWLSWIHSVLLQTGMLGNHHDKEFWIEVGINMLTVNYFLKMGKMVNRNSYLIEQRLTGYCEAARNAYRNLQTVKTFTKWHVAHTVSYSVCHVPLSKRINWRRRSRRVVTIAGWRHVAFCPYGCNRIYVNVPITPTNYTASQ